MACEHQYSYSGIRFWDGARCLPGGGATRRYYAHVYYCIKCTECRGDPIRNGFGGWNSYGPIMFNATPGSASLCGVPLEDQ